MYQLLFKNELLNDARSDGVVGRFVDEDKTSR